MSNVTISSVDIPVDNNSRNGTDYYTPKAENDKKCSSALFSSIPFQLLRGSVAGTIAKTVVYPFDRLKMIYQVKGSVVGQFRLRLFFGHVRSLIMTEGILSLWKGNFAAVCRTFPHSGIVFFCFDRYQIVLKDLDLFSAPTCRLLAGGCAGMTSTFFTYPLDVINTRMAISTGFFRYRQVTLIVHEGIPSLFRGLTPTLLGIFPYAGLSFLSFETLKAEILKHKNNRSSLTPVESMICGGMAGIISQTATYPIDTIRKVMQANTFLYHYKQSGHLGKEHPSICRAGLMIYRGGGVRGFYNGLSLNWIKGFIAAGIAFSINEQIKILQN